MSSGKDFETDPKLSGILGKYVEELLLKEEKKTLLAVAREIVNEVNESLGGKDKEIRTDPTGRNTLFLSGKKHIETVVRAFEGADLIVDYYQGIYYRGDATYSREDTYVFYPGRVDHHITNKADRNIESRVVQANAKELVELLDAVRNSKPFETSK